MTKEEFQKLDPNKEHTLIFPNFKKEDWKCDRFFIEHAEVLDNSSDNFEVRDEVEIIADPSCGHAYGSILLDGLIGKTGVIKQTCYALNSFSIRIDEDTYVVNGHCLKMRKKFIKERFVVKSTYGGVYTVEDAMTGNEVACFCNHENAEAFANNFVRKMNDEFIGKTC